MLKKIALISLLLISGLMIFVHEDQHIKDYVGSYFIHSFEQHLACKMQAHVQSINLFFPSLVLEDVTVTPADGSCMWVWCAKKYSTKFSWWHLFVYGSVDMKVDVQGLHAQTQMHNNKPVIIEHIARMVSGDPTNIPIFMKSLNFARSSLAIIAADNSTTMTFAWNSESKKIGSIFKTLLYLSDGSAQYNAVSLYRHMTGPIQIDIPDTHCSGNMLINVDCSCTIADAHTEQPCFIMGSWRYNHGLFSILSADRSVTIDSIKLDRMGKNLWLSCSGSFPLAYVGSVVAQPQLTGMGTLYIHGLANDASQGLHGHLLAERIGIAEYSLLDALKIDFKKRGSLYNGTITLNADETMHAQGAWSWNAQQGTGTLAMKNSTPVQLPSITRSYVDTDKGALAVQVDTTGFAGSYTCESNALAALGTQMSDGSFGYKNGVFSSSGTIHNYVYSCDIAVQPHVRLQRLMCTNALNKQVVCLTADPQNLNLFAGTVDLDCIRSALVDMYGYDLQGNGSLLIKGMCSKERMTTDLKLCNTSIRLPQTYNFISDGGAHIDFDVRDKKVTVNNLQCALHKGRVESSQAVASFDNTLCVKTYDVPLLFDSCLLNFNKDLFAIVSGTILLKKEITDSPLLQGQIVVERSQLKENLFSASFQKNLFKYAGNAFTTHRPDVRLDMTLTTKHPIRVDTSFLKTNAALNVHIGGCIDEPVLAGSIQLHSGTLEFPYKPLNITKGSLYFLPNCQDDPIIELVAHNTIKKYAVTLQVTGSLRDHHIMLSSVPALSEEQIIALLLVGSQEESLNIVMPALIMQNITSILFDSDHAPLKLSERFARFLKPFKHIHLVPSFSDQTGRGGLRGTLEIDINERWRALIQQNFSLTEDMRIELEYLLSDEITLRALRNERRDIGGEVEMRWKF